jgi:DNA modification methylase
VSVSILIGDCREKLRELPDASVHCCVTSPPYFGLRDYGVAGQMGLEPTPDEFVAGMVEVFREVRRVLRDDGTLWLNIGDSYNNYASTSEIPRAQQGNGSGVFKCMDQKHHDARRMAANRPGVIEGIKRKDLIGIPWMLAFALRADGWYLRQDIIWSKPNPMPESVRDRCTKAHEYLFLLSKSQRYYFDAETIAEPSTYGPDCGQKEAAKGSFAGKWSAPGDGSRNDGSFRAIRETRNKRSVWEVATQPFSEAHFATYPPALIEPCILAGCPKGGTVLDPFGGAGTTGLVADRLGRSAILIELNPEYAAIAERRLNADSPLFAEVKAA